jgi:hypothetical protein
MTIVMLFLILVPKAVAAGLDVWVPSIPYTQEIESSPWNDDESASQLQYRLTYLLEADKAAADLQYNLTQLPQLGGLSC